MNHAEKNRQKMNNNLYALYRQSMKKKRSSILVMKKEELEFGLPPYRQRRELKVKKDLNFPINRPNRNSHKISSSKTMKKRQFTIQCPSIEGNQIDSHSKLNIKNNEN